MESDNSGSPQNEGNNIQKYVMSLLFIQTKELHKKYHNDLELSPINYYLIDKEWLDNYKQKNFYDSSVEMLKSFDDYNDYEDFRQKIKSSFNIDEKNIYSIEEKYDKKNYLDKKEKIEKYSSAFNREGELVQEQFIKECYRDIRVFQIQEGYIGNETILLTDEDNDNVVYSYSLVENPENINNFYIQVESILIFGSSNIMAEEFNFLVDCQGIKNYLNRKNIDISKNEEQDILDNKGQKIGIFLNLKKSSNLQNQKDILRTKPYFNNNQNNQQNYLPTLNDALNSNNNNNNFNFINEGPSAQNYILNNNNSNLINNGSNHMNNNNIINNNNFNFINQGSTDMNSQNNIINNK